MISLFIIARQVCSSEEYPDEKMHSTTRTPTANMYVADSAENKSVWPSDEITSIYGFQDE